jgi:hypothetical protein
MNQHPFKHAELLFWDFAIRVLGCFRSARAYIAKADQLALGQDSAFLGVLVGIAGAAGLASGYLFYLLTSALR